MKLSLLVFECVKDSINLSDPNFNYYSFLAGDYKNSKDYIGQITGVFNAINLAFSRLYDNNKIAYFTKIIELNPNDKMFSFKDGTIVNIAKLTKQGYIRLPFRTMDNGQTYYLMDSLIPEKILVEYKPKIPHFTEGDIREVRLDEENKIVIDDPNIELDNYGITNPMISYIKEFVRGQLLEYIAPDLSNLHNNRAEQYFQDLEDATTAFFQNKVRSNMKGYF